MLVASSVLCSKEIMQTAVGVGFKGRNLRSELEDEVSQRCSGAVTVIEPDCDKGRKGSGVLIWNLRYSRNSPGNLG